MTTPMTRILSLSVVLAMTILGATWVNATNTEVGTALVVSAILLAGLPGLLLVWFAHDLSETSPFSRGIPKTSPPLLVSAFGWLFLLGLPALLYLALI